jgi:2-polyprenyl-3-methyl-5-hydroxy-6-metoxy-1,4-benzoquinol methylase
MRKFAPSDLEYWKNPRVTIATRYKDNDMCYATHGAQQAIIVIKELLTFFRNQALEDLLNPFSDFDPQDFWRNKTLLDFGCGTGRMSRVLSVFFHAVYGYDPVQECLDLAHTECLPIEFHNLTYGTSIPEGTVWDATCCINVLEHLQARDQNIALGLMRKHTKKNGPIVLWFHNERNEGALINTFGSDCLKEFRHTEPCILVKTFKNA